MTEQSIIEEPLEEKKPKLSVGSKEASYALFSGNSGRIGANPWTSVVDILTSSDHKKFRDIIKNCRFFFRHDPLASTVIGKMVDLAITELVVDTQDAVRVSQQEEAIFDAVSKDLLEFLREAAFEYLLTGLVVPEISLTRINETELRKRRIPRLSSLLYPTDMWIRDSKDIEIKRPPIGSGESYFVRLPEDVMNFIKNRGDWGDGTKDVVLFNQIVVLYPEFVKQIIDGEQSIKLDNPLIIKSTALADSQYPVPYLSPAIEALRHKRNLRRMDYSIAARVISAILHAKMGSDDFPLTEDQEDEVQQLENKFKWRQDLSTNDIERVFLLITNHTVSLEWVFPDVEALLNNKKYETVNQDIMVALGFPRILVTGETERSYTSDPQIATISPIQTMERMRNALLPIVNTVYFELQENNESVNNIPKVSFKPINLMSMQLFFEGLKGLYETGNLSREDYAKSYGFILQEQVEKRVREQQMLEENNLEPFQPVPHSNEPGRPTGGNPPESSPGGSNA